MTSKKSNNSKNEGNFYAHKRLLAMFKCVRYTLLSGQKKNVMLNGLDLLDANQVGKRKTARVKKSRSLDVCIELSLFAYIVCLPATVT